jgi:hemolysin III
MSTSKKLPALSKDGSVHVTDEKFNTVSHLAASIFALLGGSYLIVQSSVAGAPWHIVAFSIYTASLLFLFLSSTLHHGINGSERVEHLFRQLDYLAIFFLIAGTYTPICLGLLRSPLGWTVFGVSWFVALIGIVLKTVRPQTPKRITMTIYITLGWVAVAMIMPLYKTCGLGGVLWMAAGGLSYTIGGVFFMREKPNPIPGRFGFHEIWHIFVILGAAGHFGFLYLYVLPTAFQ